jgi:hypothetical protein
MKRSTSKKVCAKNISFSYGLSKTNRLTFAVRQLGIVMRVIW